MMKFLHVSAIIDIYHLWRVGHGISCFVTFSCVRQQQPFLVPLLGSRTPSKEWHITPNLAKLCETQNATGWVFNALKPSKHLQGALVHCEMQAERGVHDTRMCVCVLFILVLHLSQRLSQDVGLLPTGSKHRCLHLSIVIDMKFHSVTAGLIDQVPEIRFNHRCHGNRE